MACQPLTADEKAAIRARITRLEASYDAIMSGTAIRRFVDQNGETVEYNAANAANLLKLINDLKAMVDCTFSKQYRPRPVGFIFPRQ
jgi:hypothetical protein